MSVTLPVPAEFLVWALAALALGAVAGWVMSRRNYTSGIRELQAYLEGWEDGEQEGEERARERLAAGRRAVTAGRAGRSLLKPVFEKLDQHRQAFLTLRTLSTATNRRLEKLLDVLGEAVLLYDAAGRLLYVNGKMRQLAGDPAGQLAGGDTGDEDALRAVAAFLSAASDLDQMVLACLAEDAVDPEGREVEIRMDDGPRRFFATPHLIRTRSDPERYGLLLLLTDVEALEEVRRNAQCWIALEHGQLAAELMAHRLRNPLNSIVLVLELLRREAGADGKVHEQLETIQGETVKAEGTLQRFLEMMRWRERREESVDLVSVVETVCELLYPLARDRQVRLRQELHVPAASFRGDRVEVVRAVLGPALAALRDAQAGAQLKFRLDSDRREHLLSIESSGVRQASIGLTVAEELTARNRGTLGYDDPAHPARLTYRFGAQQDA